MKNINQCFGNWGGGVSAFVRASSFLAFFAACLVSARGATINVPGDHATIQAAVSAASAGDVIELMPGDHTGPDVVVDKAVTIQGPNDGLAGTNPARVAESRIFNMKITTTVAGVVIDGVEIYQTNTTPDAILLNAAATVRNSILRRFGVSAGTVASAITTAIGVNGYVIENDLFTGDLSGGLFGGHKTWQSGIYLNGGSGSISGNTFEICRGAINADDFNAGIAITGNTFRTNGTYLSFGGATPNAGSFTIAGNAFGFNFSISPSSNPTLFNNSNVAPTFRLNMTGNTFGGIATTALTNVQKFALEARNFHRGRSARNGVVDLVAGEQIVVPGTTIQSAIDAASAGEKVIVRSGSYAGPITINKNGLTLLGVSEAGVRPSISVTGATTALGTVVLPSGSTGITFEGFAINGLDSPDAGLEKAGIYLAGNQTNIAILRNTVTAAGEAAILSEFGGTVSGLVIEGNLINGSTFTGPGTGGPSGNQFETPKWPRPLVYVGGPSNGSNKTGVVFAANVVVGASGDGNNGNILINLDGSGVEVSGNTFGGTSGSGNATAALLRTRGANTAISGNEFTGNAPRAVIVGNGTANEVSENRFVGIYTTTVVNSGMAPLDTRFNYWGVANPNFTQAVSSNVTFSPWYADAGMTILVSAANFQNFTVNEGETVTYPQLFIGMGSVFTVKGSLVVGGDFILESGAILEVIDGDVTFADGTTIAGTFTFFNSFGSVNFDDDVTISGSAEGLILVSDVHVADGATITVDGTFTIDGCTVDSPGTFDLVVNATADFTMARTAFSDGTIIVNSGNTEIYDNRFTDMNIDVTASSTGARVFHNILSATADLDDAGSGTVTVVDAWGNVTDAANTENNLPLAFELAPALITGKRTIDARGVAYIQPGDAVSAAFSVGKLQEKIVGLELLLGYNTDLLGSASLGLGTNWDDVLPYTENNSANVIGRFNAAIGLDFSFPDPSGTNTDQTVGDLGLVAGINEGMTQVFHRVKFVSDIVPGTRLAKGFPQTGYLTPFTSNSPMIVIDETEPLTNTLLTGAKIEQSGQDMTQFITLQGLLEISASAFDGLAGIDDADVVVTLVGPTTYTATQAAVPIPGPTIGGDVYTTFGFEYPVTSSTLNGVYDVVFTVTDRSGNTTTTPLGEITINKNVVTATIDLEGLVAGPVTRNVTFVFTDNNVVVDTRTQSVVFTNGVGTVTFTDVNGETDMLSAKAATHLRERVPVVFTNGQSSVSYTGANELPGGDLNGDNIVNMLDYAVLRFYWLNVVGTVPAAAAAEINGNGSVNLTDYQILQSNFYQQGDPQ